MRASSSCGMNNLHMCTELEPGLDPMPVICRWSVRCSACSTQPVADMPTALMQGCTGEEEQQAPPEMSLQERIHQRYLESVLPCIR